MNCRECGINLSSTGDNYIQGLCSDCNQQKRKESFPFLEPLGSVSIQCPYCLKCITMVIHKQEKVGDTKTI